MKIIPENIIKTNKDIVRKPFPDKDAAAPEAAEKSSGRDKITIASNQSGEITDAQFIAQLKKSIISDIQAGAPEHKLNDLKQQIALDEYDVNISDIIRKIMHDNPEGGYE